jgi:hypothetical protein
MILTLRFVRTGKLTLINRLTSDEVNIFEYHSMLGIATLGNLSLQNFPKGGSW